MTIKVGDRVKVEFEGKVESAGSMFRVSVADGSSAWFDEDELTVIPKPIVLPTKKNALIHYNVSDHILMNGYWYVVGSRVGWTEEYTLEQAQFSDDYRVIFEGEDD